MKSTSESVIDSKSKNLSIQDISTVHLKFNINDVINTLIFKNALYISLIMYNIVATKSLRVKDFLVAI